MNVLLLTRSPAVHGTVRLAAALRGRGHGVRVVDPLAAVLHLSGGGVTFLDEAARSGDTASPGDVVVPRCGAALFGPALAVLRQLEDAGCRALNSSEALGRARDKVVAAQTLARAGLPAPATAHAPSPERLDAAIAAVGGLPVVLKPITGSRGEGIELVRTSQDVLRVAASLDGRREAVLVQAFVPEARRDVRVLVLDGEVVAAVLREAADGDFRSNAARGSRVEAHAPTDAVRRLAVEAVAAFGLDLAGVDVVETAEGPLLLEVNANPGFQAVETATGVDVAEAIARAVERRAADAVGVA